MTNIANEQWIENELIPKLLQNNKFSVKNTANLVENKKIIVKMCAIEPLSTKDAFMLTQCYKVKLILYTTSEQNENCVCLIVKVLKALNDDVQLN